MEVIADFHIHSHFSLATGQAADLEHLDLWGRYKGVRVVGSGDCTHPEWLKELAAKLEPVAAGVYELKPGLALPLNLAGPRWEAVPPVRFLITGEVSTIYKKGGRVRKVHLLLLLPHLEAAQRLSQRLGRLGNVTSDGRPILGLEAKFVLEAALEADPASLVIPAHIWTPWFSVLGAKSGFDSLEECFEEQTEHIYALETGLSSDPAMNWRVSALDRYLLLSNSDAHSPQKIAREANIFLVPPTYPDLARAIRSQSGFGGTIEFFPQEGKYHQDGHRQCGLRATAEEAMAWGGRCPRCQKPLTYGVMHRVLDLADRPPGDPAPGAKPFTSLITLPEVLAQVLGVKAGSKKVQRAYFPLLEQLGPELEILRHSSLEDLAGAGSILLAHAVDRMRRGEVHIAAGYDGAYGEISLFTAEERGRLQGQGAFWTPPPPSPEPAASSLPPPAPKAPEPEGGPAPASQSQDPIDPLLAGLNPEQQQAVRHQGPPLVVQAGPGTGKTRALTHRLAYLLARRETPPEEILAVTFTRQAAGEMESRIRLLLPDYEGFPRLTVKTFHALGHQMLLSHREDASRQVADEETRRKLLRRAAKDQGLPSGRLDSLIARWKQALLYPEDLGAEEDPEAVAAYRHYEALLALEGLWDYEDLIARPVRLLQQQPPLQESYRRRFRHLLVDEYQDLNEAQYRLFLALAGPETEIMVIGDPHQAIYGFRGAAPVYFQRFLQDFPGALSLSFRETYRLTPPMVQAAHQVLGPDSGAAPLISRHPGEEPLGLLELPTAASEAAAIAREIEKLVGGLSHLALEDDHLRHQEGAEKAGFRDVAVLYRLHALGPELERSLTAAGIPCQLAREGVGPEWDGLDLAAEKVKLLTLHAAKGLEFPYVFIAGCETGLLPWEPEGTGCSDVEEERRLFYVGLTRASRQVFLSRSRVRFLWGKRRRTQLSPLVQAISRDLIQSLETHRVTPPPVAQQPRLFPAIKAPQTKRGR